MRTWRRPAPRRGQNGDVAASSAALSDLFRTVDLFGVFANAVLGGIIARAL